MENNRKPRVLLTGFTPFGGETVNPALEAVKRVRCPETELRILEVPTVFGDSARLVTAEMDAFRPDVVLCVGQAAGRSAVTPERVAINVDDARIPDNAGQQPVDAPIVPGGPAAYFATAPVKDMVRAIREAGVPSELSNSAGTYVCNHLLYCVLHHARRKGSGVTEKLAACYCRGIRYALPGPNFTIAGSKQTDAYVRRSGFQWRFGAIVEYLPF